MITSVVLRLSCADYRVPVVLRLMGVLQYSQQLAHKVPNTASCCVAAHSSMHTYGQAAFATAVCKTSACLRFLHSRCPVWLLLCPSMDQVHQS